MPSPKQALAAMLLAGASTFAVAQASPPAPKSQEEAAAMAKRIYEEQLKRMQAGGGAPVNDTPVDAKTMQDAMSAAGTAAQANNGGMAEMAIKRAAQQGYGSLTAFASDKRAKVDCNMLVGSLTRTDNMLSRLDQTAAAYGGPAALEGLKAKHNIAGARHDAVSAIESRGCTVPKLQTGQPRAPGS